MMSDFADGDDFPAAPIVFPASAEALSELTVAQLTALENFYELPRGRGTSYN